MVYQEPTDQELRNILRDAKKIAVVGISNKPDRPSYQVAKYMKEAGYEIIPINPTIDEVFGIKSVKTLSELEDDVDIINVFRRSEETVPVAEAAVKTKAKVLWLQLGIFNEEAAKIAMSNGMKVVMDHCIKIDHARLMK
jgi:predicted CoA-binding protein